MSPLSMETGYEPNSPGSVSAEDWNSHTAGSEREADGQQVGNRGRKRRDKNRDAARKSRKKQTERADLLHEELQRLERSNSSLQKEIAALKKDLLNYTTALERHEPHCRLGVAASSSSSPSCRSASPSLGCRTSSSPPRAPSQTSNSALLAVPSFSTSLNSSVGLQTLDGFKSAHILPSKSAATLFSTSADHFIPSSSNPVTVSCSTLPPPHSLFSVEPAITSRLTSVTPVRTGPASNPVPSSAQNVGAHPQSEQDTFHETSPLSADACFSAFCSDTPDAFIAKETSSITASSNVAPPYPHVPTEDAGPAQGSGVIPNLYGGNPNNSRPLCSLLPLTLQDSALQYPVSPQASSPAFPSKPSYNQQITSNPAPLLSLLTVPSPLYISQTTSSSSDEQIAQSPPSWPLLLNPSRDLSLSELLEVNDWILSGNNLQ